MQEKILNYEVEIENKLIINAREMFSVKDNHLLSYLHHRYWIHMIQNNKLPVYKKAEVPVDFMMFWMKELGLTPSNLTYYSLEISPMNLRQLSTNIFDSIHERKAREVPTSWNLFTYQSLQEARNTVQDWLSEAKRRYRKQREEIIYDTLLKWHLYKRLNHHFSAMVKEPCRIEGFMYADEWNVLSEETKLNRELQAYRFGLHQSPNIKEDDLETYIANHLSILGEGFTLLQRQKTLPKGRIDLLAKDKEERLWIIELKVEKDTDVVWQKWYYTKELQRLYPQREVGFILIAPSIDTEIAEPLLEGNVPTKLYTYDSWIAKGELQSVSLEHYQYDN